MVRCWVVGAAPGWIILHQLHPLTGSPAHSLMTLCACQSFRSAALWFLHSAGEAVATPSDVFVLLLCPHCCGVITRTMIEQGAFFFMSCLKATTCGCSGASMWLKTTTLKNGRLSVDCGSGMISRLHRWKVVDLEPAQAVFS